MKPMTTEPNQSEHSVGILHGTAQPQVTAPRMTDHYRCIYSQRTTDIFEVRQYGSHRAVRLPILQRLVDPETQNRKSAGTQASSAT